MIVDEGDYEETDAPLMAPAGMRVTSVAARLLPYERVLTFKVTFVNDGASATDNDGDGGYYFRTQPWEAGGFRLHTPDTDLWKTTRKITP
jgi:hypothetical protein